MSTIDDALKSLTSIVSSAVDTSRSLKEDVDTRIS